METLHNNLVPLFNVINYVKKKKFKCKIVPIYIQRTKDINFKLTVHKPLEYSRDDSIQFITSEYRITPMLLFLMSDSRS